MTIARVAYGHLDTVLPAQSRVSKEHLQLKRLFPLIDWAAATGSVGRHATITVAVT